MAIPFHDRRSGEILYHGTNVDLTPGSVVEPREVSTQNLSKGQPKAYATTDLNVARKFAFIKDKLNMKVYHVEPVDPKEQFETNQDGSHKAVISKKGFKVVRRVE